MTRPAIPAGLVPLLSGYSLGAPAGALRTAVGGGIGRYGLEYDRGTTVFNVTLMLSAVQFSVWSVFYQRVIKLGTITFDMPLDSGLGVTPHACNIVPGSYTASRNSDRWVITFQVEAMGEANTMTDAQAEAVLMLYALYGEDAKRLLDRLARFANYDTNVLDF